MQQNHRNTEYFSMTLNPDKERDRHAIDILKSQPQKAKSDFVKNAIIAYGGQGELQAMLAQIVREVMAEEIPALVCEAIREAVRDNPTPAPMPAKPATQKEAPKANSRTASSATQKALGFMAGLQGSSE